jgi:glycosyltransferase involved in cell wall biosynthesis
VTGDRRRVLVTCGTFEPGFRGGGPVRSVAHIVDTASDRIDVVLITSDRDAGGTEPYPGLTGQWCPRGRARIFYLNVRAPRQWLRLGRDLRAVPFDLLYVNSFLSPLFTVLPILAVRLRLLRCGALLIAPRGELSAGARSLKATKKRIFLRCWGRFLAGAAVRWHASSEREAGEIRAVYPRAAVDVRANQVRLPRQPAPPTAGGPTARLIFVGRISPIKNVHRTIEALRLVNTSVEFDIYGPVVDRAYWSRCRSMIELLPARVQVRYRGELAPEQVRAAFAGYDAFVFPTGGENFGHVIAESLSVSCPVVCSAETPWSDVLTAGGGRVLRGDQPRELGAELQRIAAMTPAERLHARERAGEAYRTWRAGATGPNILDQVLG